MTVIAATPTYTAGAYRPPQWSQAAMVAITQTPSQGQANSGAFDANGVLSTSGSTAVTYVFDAVLLLDHEQRLEKTQHPVQTGAVISSHAYLMPARVSLDVGMSDVMDSYSSSTTGLGTLSPTGSIMPANVAPFNGASSKSVSAYQTVLQLQSARQPLTVTTRLRTYTNMVITSVAPQESAKTIAGLRMRVDFEQIFTASTVSSPVSARPDVTQNTALGVVNPAPISTATQSQFQVLTPGPNTSVSSPLTTPAQLPGNPGYAVPDQQGFISIPGMGPVQVPGAGTYSSEPGQQALP
jgi:hypothetical protein